MDAPTEPVTAEPAPPPPSTEAPPPPRKRRRARWILALAIVLGAIAWGVSFYWSREPEVLWVVAETPEGERLPSSATRPCTR